MTTTTNAILAPEPLTPLHEHSPEAHWSLGTRFAFRFCCAYALMQWVTLCVWLLTPTVTLGLFGRPDFYGPLTGQLGKWLMALILNLPEQSPPRLSGNYLPHFLGIMAVAAICAVGALTWSALDRGRTKAHPRLFVWLHTLMRFLLGATMLRYGWAKVLPQQFSMTLDYMALEVGQHNPRDLLWAFMIGSRDYQIFTGFVEVAGGLLLLTRRTAMLGAIISMAAMANVLALDISYDEGIKFLAGQIFLMSLFVLAPFAIRFFSVFDLTRDVHAAPARRLFQSESVDRAARVVGVVLSVWIAWTTLQDCRNGIARKNRALQANAILGIWDVEAMTKNGTPVPLLITDATLWRRLVAHSNNAAVIVPMTQSAPQSQWTGRPTAVRCNVRLDSASQTVQFTPFPFLGAVGPVDFAYALPDPDHLVLTSRNQNETTVVVRLRRFDLSAYPLLNWERHWSW